MCTYRFSNLPSLHCAPLPPFDVYIQTLYEYPSEEPQDLGYSYTRIEGFIHIFLISVGYWVKQT